MIGRELSDIPFAELVAAQVWVFSDDEEFESEACLVPAESVPVSSLDNSVAVLPVRLASGQHLTGVIGNFDHRDAGRNQHFLTLSIFLPSGELFHLARYHDRNLERSGPEALARALGVPLERVFPIQYDLSAVLSADSVDLAGEIVADPPFKLSRLELIRLAVP